MIDPYHGKDDHNRSYIQINMITNDSILCARAYNKRMMNRIETDIRKDTMFLITGHVDSILCDNELIVVLMISEYSITNYLD